jgi:rod shape-determining protein MreC
MIADHRFHALETVRLSLSVLAHPVQQVASFPGDARAGSRTTSRARTGCCARTRSSRRRCCSNRPPRRRRGCCKAEQEQLLSMLPGGSRYAESGIIAEVLYTARNPFTRKIVVDKGLTQSIKSGMPAIDGSGVVGQVTNVGTFTSEVTLVTEKDQSVPVMLVRNGLRAIAVGSGKDGAIEVPFMPVSADVQSGDVFVTSGIDGTYPPGLVVAQVTSVEKNAAYAFAKIVAQARGRRGQHRYVMLLADERARGAAEAEDEPAKKPARIARARGGPAEAARPHPARAGRDEAPGEPGAHLLLAARRLCLLGAAVVAELAARAPDLVLLVLLFWALHEPRAVGQGWRFSWAC